MYYSIDKSREFNIIANILSDKVGVKILPKETWACNILKKEIYYPRGTMLIESDIGYIIHEAGHIRFTTFDENMTKKELDKLKKKYKKNTTQVFHLFNALEDVRIENEMLNLYRGAKYYLDNNTWEAYNSYIMKIDDIYCGLDVKNKEYFKKFKHHQFNVYYSFQLQLGNRNSDILIDYFHNDVKVAIKNTYDIIEKDFPKCKNSLDVWNLVLKLLPEYLPLCDDIDEEKEKEEQKEQEDKDKEEEENKKKMEELMKAIEELVKGKIKELINKMESIKDKIEEGEELSEDDDEFVDEFMDKVKELDNEEEDEMLKAKITPKGFTSIKDIFGKKIFFEDGLTEEELKDNVNRLLPQTRKSISILKDLETTRFEGNYQSGKLQNRKVHKIIAGYSNIFSRKVGEQDDNQDMAIALLVDESGSMRGRQARVSCIASTLLARALELSGKSYAVYGFNDYFFTHKPWSSKLNYTKMLDIKQNVYDEGASYNNDGYAIWKTSQELLKRPEKNKIMIVLSDGKPASSYNLSPEGEIYRDYDLKTEAKKAEKIAKVYSIGIMDDSVEEYYQRTVVIRKIEELPKVLLKFFKENTGKRIR